jgi:hypothetical protein
MKHLWKFTRICVITNLYARDSPANSDRAVQHKANGPNGPIDAEFLAQTASEVLLTGTFFRASTVLNPKDIVRQCFFETACGARLSRTRNLFARGPNARIIAPALPLLSTHRDRVETGREIKKRKCSQRDRTSSFP